MNSVRLPDHKSSAEKHTAELFPPESVVILMSQHGGVPCKPVVSTGDSVMAGQLIGDSDANMSAPVHSSVAGKVTGTAQIINIFGRVSDALVIARESDELFPGIEPPTVRTREELIEAVRKSGCVGLGGAGFPTHIKLAFDPKTTKVDTLVINAAECEPYITSDYRAMIEDSGDMLFGIKRIMELLCIDRTIIGIEKNKPAAIEKLRTLTADESCIKVAALRSAYPQGAEKVLIKNTTGRTVRAGELPSSAGCLVLNCSTAAFIGSYLRTGIPLIKRRITVDGTAVAEPVNFFVPTGTRVSHIVGHIKLSHEPVRAVFGGPMMGNAFYDKDMPVTKTCSAITLYRKAWENSPTACLRCGRCVRVCPMGLMPAELEQAYDRKDKELLKKLCVELCLDCGSCSYICPARRNLAEKNQLAKALLKSTVKVNTPQRQH